MDRFAPVFGYSWAFARHFPGLSGCTDRCLPTHDPPSNRVGRDRIRVGPGKPSVRVCGKLLEMACQCDEVVEGLDGVESAGVVEAHEQIPNLDSRLGFVR